MALIKDKIKQQNKEEYAYKKMLSYGWTPDQAAGIVGNLIRESNLNTTILGTADTKGSKGIAQWHSGRLETLQNKYGSNWTDLDNQLDFVNWELNNTHKKAGDKLRTAQGVYNTGRIVSDDYERPKVKFNADTKRQNLVLNTYKKLSGSSLTDSDQQQFLKGTAQRAIDSYTPTINEPTPIYTPEVSNLVSIIDIPTLASENETEAVKKAKEELNIKQQEQINQQRFIQDLLVASQVQYVDPNQVQQEDIYNQEQYFQRGGATRQDSLNTYNNSRIVEKYYRDLNYNSLPPSEIGIDIHKDNEDAYNEFRTNYKNNQPIYINKNGNPPTLSPSMREFENVPVSDYRKEIDNNRYLQREIFNQYISKDAPLQLFDRRIDPVREKDYIKGDDKVRIYSYNSIANKPFDLLTEAEKKERVEKYGRNGVPKSYSTTERTVQKNPTIGKVNQIRKEGLVELNTSFEPNQVNIPNQYVQPKYWDVQDNINSNFGATQTNYRVTPETADTMLRTLAPEPYNSRIVYPYYQSGGINQDDQGYWNPDNWGKVVEINSNNISMQNVNQPLIGVSNETGESKLMMPGKNYIFENTNKVTEYPTKRNKNKRFS